MSDYHLQQLAAASASVPGGQQGQPGAIPEGVQAAATAAALAAPATPAPTAAPVAGTCAGTAPPQEIQAPPAPKQEQQPLQQQPLQQQPLQQQPPQQPGIGIAPQHQHQQHHVPQQNPPPQNPGQQPQPQHQPPHQPPHQTHQTHQQQHPPPQFLHQQQQHHPPQQNFQASLPTGAPPHQQYAMAPVPHHAAPIHVTVAPPSLATQIPGIPPMPMDPMDLERKYQEKCTECNALRHDLDLKSAEIRRLKQELYKKTNLKLKPSGVEPAGASSATDLSGEGITIDVDIGPSSSRTRSYDQRWKGRFQDLVKYKLQHGDCIVPKSYKDKALHSWVRKQRILKKDFDLGLASDESMTQERVNALNSIGFAWVVGHQSNEPQWENNFQALVVFKSQYGHTRVPQSYDKTLHKWVLNQRCRRRLLEEKGEGKAKGMTWTRIEKLDAIDFAWSGKK